MSASPAPLTPVLGRREGWGGGRGAGPGGRGRGFWRRGGGRAISPFSPSPPPDRARRTAARPGQRGGRVVEAGRAERGAPPPLSLAMRVASPLSAPPPPPLPPCRPRDRQARPWPCRAAGKGDGKSGGQGRGDAATRPSSRRHAIRPPPPSLFYLGLVLGRRLAHGAGGGGAHFARGVERAGGKGRGGRANRKRGFGAV